MFKPQHLKNWIIENHAEQKAIAGFWLNIQNCRKEDPKEFNEYFPNYEPNYLTVNVKTISIRYRNYPDLDYNHIVISIPIVYKNKQIGYYDYLLSFDGDVEDDSFVIL
jgi:hypothetical protein